MCAMKKKLLLIGGGTIATHYKTALMSSPLYELVGLVDVNPNCASRKLFPVPFFTDVNEALKTGAEVAMISTTPAAHYPIAKELLERKIAVITEKPMCENLDEIVELKKLALHKNCDMGCLFHWKFADEVQFLKSQKMHLGSIKSITVKVCDDYAATPDGNVRADRKGLAGAWIDSGINILSYVSELCDVSNSGLLKMKHVCDENGQVKFANRVYKFGETTADITVDWREACSEKTSEIVCEAGVVKVNHSKQTVWLNGKIIYQNTVADRLSSHYCNAFQAYQPTQEEMDDALLLHEILFEGGAV